MGALGRVVRWPAVLPLALLLGGVYLVSTRCAPSSGSLESAARGKPGVVDVRVVDNGGEDDIPFTSLPRLVTVTMRSTATEDQVQDVVDEYEGDLSRGFVELLTIELDGDVSGTLAMGRGGPDTEALVGAFVAAAHHPRAEEVQVGVEYVYGKHDDTESLRYWASLRLAGVDFDQTREAFDTLGERMERDAVDFRVAGDGFRFADSGGPAERLPAQMAAAAAVDDRFGLLGAEVLGKKQLVLRVPAGVAPRDVRTVALRAAGERDLGKVVVAAGMDVDLTSAPPAVRERARRVVDHLRFQSGFTSAVYEDGELRIRVTDLNVAFGVDGVVQSSLEFEPAEEPDLEAAYLPLTVRYLRTDGTDVLKKPGATVSSYVDTYEIPRQGWLRVTMVASPRGARLHLYAPRTMSRADAKYYADYFAEGRRGSPPLRITVTWPEGSGRQPLEVSGT